MLFVFLVSIPTILQASIKLPEIFTDNMILQRNNPVTIWGLAGKNETLTLVFNGQRVQVKANGTGQWEAVLKPMTHGGPFEMRISTKKEIITLKNILIGDVWLCSGQSNMEWILKNTRNAEQEIAAANHAGIRMFTVARAMAMQPQQDLAGGEWMECNPGNASKFSAVAYFFARKLNEDLGVPIGLINSSWGGTNIQAWTSWDVMGSKAEYKEVDFSKIEQSFAEAQQRKQAFLDAFRTDKGIEEKWYAQDGSSAWKKIKLPNTYEGTEIGVVDGIVWFRKTVELPDLTEGKMVTLQLGPIDDLDSTYINGKLIGTINNPTMARVYQVPAGILKKGKNTIVVKVTDMGKRGGFHGMAEDLFIEHSGKRISLAGDWDYKASVLSGSFGIVDVGPNGFPSRLYNGMIAPVTRFRIKGAIWYQGESNANEAFKYRTMFPEMINDWRSKWKYEFPFLWVQLANFMQADSLPAESEWAELREAQHQALSLPQTGEAVIIDIGEAKDIHPRNKQDVGMRLALAAEKVAYQKDIVYSGPVLAGMKKEGNRILLQFTNTGGGLVAKDRYGYLKGFAIAGTDKKFIWAKAEIKGDNVIVYNNTISSPVAVRYAWGDNPDDANLYNKEGLPASPFRTDGLSN
ncbi:9-O-acetylesterase [Flavihumibacter solisilvae]|uniref:9-O-acetylesterase n=1 Tax=Flavihumibacter solisilvae TaxID=1349421 RepID=A0A0C1IFY8_9BACT|nr:9-O-acetylesterase [Flavihumibacter solisilvae]